MLKWVTSCKSYKQVRGQYILGRIVEVHQNKRDELVRVVQVQTKDGTYTRPINKLSMILPVDWETN